MKVTRQNITELTKRIQHVFKPKYGKMVTDLRTLNQLEYVNGFVYVKLSQHYTLSEIEEFLVLGSDKNSLDDGIDVLNAKIEMQESDNNNKGEI
jgi:hypothetical protein